MHDMYVFEAPLPVLEEVAELTARVLWGGAGVFPATQTEGRNQHRLPNELE